MYCINVKEQFDVRFMIKAPIFSRQGFNMFQAHNVLVSTYYLSRVLAMFLFLVIICHSAIEIGPYSLYRRKVIAEFKLNKKIVRSRYSFPRKKRWFASHKPNRLEKATILYMLCICTRSRARAHGAKILRSRDAQCNSKE